MYNINVNEKSFAKLSKWAITRAYTYFSNKQQEDAKSQLGHNKNFKKKEKRSMLRNVIVNTRPITAAKPVLAYLSMLTNF